MLLQWYDLWVHGTIEWSDMLEVSGGHEAVAANTRIACLLQQIDNSQAANPMNTKYTSLCTAAVPGIACAVSDMPPAILTCRPGTSSCIANNQGMGTGSAHALMSLEHIVGYVVLLAQTACSMHCVGPAVGRAKGLLCTLRLSQWSDRAE